MFCVFEKIRKEETHDDWRTYPPAAGGAGLPAVRAGRNGAGRPVHDLSDRARQQDTDTGTGPSAGRCAALLFG